MLEFYIKNQMMKRIDKFDPATDSLRYLKAKFTFASSDWNGYTKVALFKANNTSYSVAIDEDNTCTVPHEVLQATENSYSKLNGNNTKVYVTVYGTKSFTRITTNELLVQIKPSGFTSDSANSEEPTPNVYNQFVEQFQTASQEVRTAASDVKETESNYRNLYANALKGNASGEVVRVDDVMPFEHTANVVVKGKNLFDVSKITNTDVLSNNGNGTLTVAANTYYCRLNQKLSEVCPHLKAGDTAVLSFNSDSASTKYMYFHGLQGTWNNGAYLTLTDAILDSYITMYGYSDTNAGKACVISNIQIELGNIATEYTPYVDPESVTLTRCGKNFFDVSKVVTDAQGQVANNNDIITIKTTATSSAVPIDGCTLGYLAPYLKAGETYTLFAETTGTQKQIWLDKANIKWAFGNSIVVTQDMLESIVFLYASGNSTTAVISKMQIEYGTIVTAYEDYEEAEAYTPNTDGTCEVVSLSPTMTLYTDTEGVTIDCEYKKDTNKVIENLVNAVIALGGNL